MTIPSIAVASLFGLPSPDRDRTDAQIAAAAMDAGFMTVSGLTEDLAPTGAARRELLRLFSIGPEDKRRMLRQSFAPENPSVYRGFFPLQPGGSTWKEGIDMGPDVAHADWQPDPADPLTERTPLPDERVLPGWRRAVAHYYRGMERLGAALMRSLARSLGLDEATFDEAFRDGISTLRLIRYPERHVSEIPEADAAKAIVMHGGRPRVLIGGAHIDSGFVTLLAQDGVEGLQARDRAGGWIDVPPVERTLAVNFGGLLERWTGGRIRATEHRVLGPGRERFSIPFFYEPRVDAVIRPLPGGPDFAPFSYGDHLSGAMTRFVEFADIKDRRRPRGI